MTAPILFFNLTRPPLIGGSLPPPTPEEWDPSCRFIEGIRNFILNSPSTLKKFRALAAPKRRRSMWCGGVGRGPNRGRILREGDVRRYFEEDFPNVWVVGGPVTKLSPPEHEEEEESLSFYEEYPRVRDIKSDPPPPFQQLDATRNTTRPFVSLSRTSERGVIRIPQQLFRMFSYRPPSFPSLSRPQNLEILLRLVFHQLAIALVRHFSPIGEGAEKEDKREAWGDAGWEIEAALFGSWMEVEWKVEKRARLDGIEKVYLTVAPNGPTIVLDHPTHLLWSQTILSCLVSFASLPKKSTKLLKRLRKESPRLQPPLSQGCARDRTSIVFYTDVEVRVAERNRWKGYPISSYISRSREVGEESETTHLVRLKTLSAGVGGRGGGEVGEGSRCSRTGLRGDERLKEEDVPMCLQIDFPDDISGEKDNHEE